MTSLPAVALPTSLEDSVFQTLLDAIADGHFTPETPLNALEIAQDLGVSRTPVSTALRRLKEAGVLVPSRGGVVVPPLSFLDLEHLYGVRGVLEGLAASSAAACITSDQLRFLQQDVAENRMRIASFGSLADLRGPERFHRTILDCVNNPRLVHVHSQNHLHIRRYLHIALAKEPAELLRQGLDEHEELLHALERRDSADAERAARYHADRSRDRVAGILRLLQESSASFDFGTASPG